MDHWNDGNILSSVKNAEVGMHKLPDSVPGTRYQRMKKTLYEPWATVDSQFKSVGPWAIVSILDMWEALPSNEK